MGNAKMKFSQVFNLIVIWICFVLFSSCNNDGNKCIQIQLSKKVYKTGEYLDFSIMNTCNNPIRTYYVDIMKSSSKSEIEKIMSIMPKNSNYWVDCLDWMPGSYNWRSVIREVQKAQVVDLQSNLYSYYALKRIHPAERDKNFEVKSKEVLHKSILISKAESPDPNIYGKYKMTVTYWKNKNAHEEEYDAVMFEIVR